MGERVELYGEKDFVIFINIDFYFEKRLQMKDCLHGVLKGWGVFGLFFLFACGGVRSEYVVPLEGEHERVADGVFEPTLESLQGKTTPEWFRDAKFGIWAHWGPQCVEGSGDWMARMMYYQGSEAYNHHVEHYGHPSEFGFKDVIPLFGAENWDPDALVSFYKRIGAQYFFALGNHHDNMDLWDSKYQPWNSVNMGPHRDVLAEWERAARRAGLPFGISFHADHAWIWYEPSQLSDTEGEFAGVPYDGCLTAADGKGKWWEGFDPQDLYAQGHELSIGSENAGSIFGQWEWGGGAVLPSKAFCANFFDRTVDAINRYSPDLVYFDATVLPFYPVSDVGLRIAAHFYNSNMAAHGGELQGVLFGKILDEGWRKALTWEIERGAADRILEDVWQSCSCIGGWHYNTGIYESGGYKSAATVAKLLVDIVSKNGNLLLSVPLRADGTLDEKEVAILEEFGLWMDVNKEAIVGSRPWVVFGEGPIARSEVRLNAQGFNEGVYAAATSEEIRFTRGVGCVYATVLAWPVGGVVDIVSFAGEGGVFDGVVEGVELLGYGAVRFERRADVLRVWLPSKPLNGIAPVLRIGVG